MDGERRLIKKEPDYLTGINRKGQEVELSHDIRSELLFPVDESYLLDGEIVNGKIYLFDYIVQNIPYKQRLALLSSQFRESNMLVHLNLVNTAYGTERKRILLSKLITDNAEGIVFKDLRAMYTSGRPNSGGSALKYKFTDSCTCIVGSINATKRSVSLQLLDENGAGVEVGNVTIYPNFDIPLPATLVEIQYLYAYKGGSLYQPVYKGPRQDIEFDDCKLSQLKYKQEIK